MAGLFLTATNSVASIGTSTTKTLLSVKAASGHRVRVQGVKVTFNGTSATDVPALVTLTNSPATGGTTSALSASYGIQFKNFGDGAAGLAAQSSATAWSVEPSTNTILGEFQVHPQTAFVLYWPTGQEYYLSGANYFSVRVTTGSSFSASSVTVDIDFEE